MHRAAESGDLPALQRLLAAAPGLAIAADSHGWTPLARAAYNRQEAAVRLLLEAAPATALRANDGGELPLHLAAIFAPQSLLQQLLGAAPATSSAVTRSSRFALHYAAGSGNLAALQLLVSFAPAAASARGGFQSRLPLEIALNEAGYCWRRGQGAQAAQYLQAARLLLPVTPLDEALSALVAAGCPALPLFADLAASRPLTYAQWQRVPAACPGLGAALPAVLARSVSEARWLVQRLSGEQRQRVRSAALSLRRAQRTLGVELPVAVLGQVLALVAASV